MDAVRKALDKVAAAGETENNASSSSPSFVYSSPSSSSPSSSSSTVSTSSVIHLQVSPPHSPLVLTSAPSREALSYGACSKLCAIFFVAGLVLGYTQRRRVRRWASKVLKQLKDD